MKNGQRLTACHTVVDLLALAAGVDQPFAAQHRQLLGQRRLNNAQQLFQLADIALAVHQLAEQQQTVTIGQCLQQLMGLIGRTAQALDISLVVHDSSTISCNTLLTNNI